MKLQIGKEEVGETLHLRLEEDGDAVLLVSRRSDAFLSLVEAKIYSDGTMRPISFGNLKHLPVSVYKEEKYTEDDIKTVVEYLVCNYVEARDVSDEKIIKKLTPEVLALLKRGKDNENI